MIVYMMNKSEILFYIGSILIISVFVFVLIGKFKDDTDIDLKEHKFLILTYILLMIAGLVAWRKLYLIIITNTYGISKYNNVIQELLNG